MKKENQEEAPRFGARIASTPVSGDIRLRRLEGGTAATVNVPTFNALVDVVNAQSDRLDAIENTPPLPVTVENPWTPSGIAFFYIIVGVVTVGSLAILHLIGLV